MRIFLLVLSLLFLLQYHLPAQGSALPIGIDNYHLIDRLDILYNDQTFHTSIKPYLRGDIIRFSTYIDTSGAELSDLDIADLQYIYDDNNEWLKQAEFSTTLTGKIEPLNEKKYVDSTKTFYTIRQSVATRHSPYYRTNEKPVFKYFYKTPANFFELNRPYFQLKLNPIINFRLAKEQGDDELVFQNTRGLELRGAIDERIYFYSNILENQSRFASYVNERVIRDAAIPGASLYKGYRSQFLNITDGYDYLFGQAYIGFNLTKHVGMQLGHGTNAIGNGYRSLLLSDFGSNYFYLKFNTKVWRIHYQNIFAELGSISANSARGDNLIPKKYMAAHYLNFQLAKNLKVGLYEAVIFSRNNQFELQYLNPLILYRTVEQYIGSPDNVLIGINTNWNLYNRFQLYGQLMLDEFKFSELIIERRGWWANKFGYQLGLKYINTFGIDHLDTQVEFNSVRPYTYTHRDSSTSYTHYHQPLAHPLGANFREIIFKTRYQPFSKLIVDTRLIFMNYGEDEDASVNWGNNIILPHTSRVMDFGNEIGQGIGTKTILIGIDLSYQLFHNTFIDLYYLYRNQESDLEERSQRTSYIGGGFRMNISNKRFEF